MLCVWTPDLQPPFCAAPCPGHENEYCCASLSVMPGQKALARGAKPAKMQKIRPLGGFF